LNTISVIIPTLNEELELPMLFECLKKQTLRPSEIIVVDAGSTDNTAQWAASNGAIVVSGGGLPGVNRNLGASIAKSSWLLFIDADIRMPPETLEVMLSNLNTEEFCAASCYFNPEPTTPLISLLHYLARYYFRYSTAVGWPHAIGGFLLVKKSIHIDIKGFDEEVLVAEDQDYVKRIMTVGQYLFMPSPVVLISSRRFIKRGALRMGMMWLLIELHRILIGEIKNNRYNYFG
jgi:glycosyltransferase involved in cell wall biosynthesis